MPFLRFFRRTFLVLLNKELQVQSILTFDLDLAIRLSSYFDVEKTHVVFIEQLSLKYYFYVNDYIIIDM